MSCCWLALVAALSVTASQSPGEQPGPETKKPAAKAEQPEQLPVPRRVERLELDAIYVFPSLPPQLGTREVWQYYGVDRSGRFLPRVIQAPHGAYYLYNGRPYPWTTTRPTLHMPYALD